MDVASLRTRAIARVRRPERGEARLALAALHSLLDAGSAGAHWSINPDGVLGRSLVMNAGARYTVPLALAGPVTLSGRAMLMPHDWVDGADRVTATVTATGPTRPPAELWSTTLRAGDRGRPRGRAFRCEVPATTTALSLTLTVPQPLRPRGVTRALWHELTLHDAAAASAEERPARDRYVAPTATGREPLISILTPVHDPPAQMLKEAVDSVIGQTYSNWELCLVDDGSRDPRVRAALAHYAQQPRVKLLVHERARGISGATNAALGMATGEFVALLDHDDTLAPEALRHVADRLASDPGLDMVYSDEDVVADGTVLERHPKPGWSPEHMRALMYTCHLGIYRRSLAEQVGGFRSRFDGCQDYDFVLRLMERTDRISHVPQILYHWRAHPDSTAGGDAKPYAYLAQPGAISEHLERAGIVADVQFSHLPGLHRLVHRVDPGLTVEIVLACDDPDALHRAATSWMQQPHPSWRAVIATHDRAAIAAALSDAGIPQQRLTLIDAERAITDATALLGQAAQHATAEQLLLMQAPAIGLTHDWLTRLIGYGSQPGIAAAGPVILAPDGRIREAGIALPHGIPLHLNYGQPAAAAQPVVYNLSAVSGVLATPRAVLARLGGLRPEYRGLALIEYCLRAGSDGGRTVLVPDVRLRMDGRPVNDLPALWRLRDEWGRGRVTDPYYNPNFLADRGDFIPRSSR